MKRLRIATAQLETVVGDLAGNRDRVIAAAREAVAEGASILLTPEAVISGYPAEDLLGDAAFLQAVEDTVSQVAAATADLPITVVLGAPVRTSFLPTESPGRLVGPTPLDATPRTVRNALLVLRGGEVVAARTKALLPTTAVFDDSRWTLPGLVGQGPVEIDGVRVGLLVCEDVWGDAVVDALAADGAEVLLVANASPFQIGKLQRRRDLLRAHADRVMLPIVYVNAVGGQDELVFDGGSMVVGPSAVLTLSPTCRAHLGVVDLSLPQAPHEVPAILLPEGREAFWGPLSREAAVYEVLVHGVGDYVRRNGFHEVVIGLSGGLDSALAATIAVDALGPEAVRGIGMPGPYSSAGSVDDARDLADRLGIHFDVLPIKETFEAELALLGEHLSGPGEAVARENIQARLRALHLMTIANARGAMMLNTGNRSESAVGYFTLGGDSSGGFAPLKDVPKTLVYALSRWRNKHRGYGTEAPIPDSTIDKPPSAELAPDQQDSDSLPPYEVLDRILELYLEEAASATTIAGALAAEHGIRDEGATVLRVLSMVDRAEHKRRQVAPGIKVTERAFGRSRRVPITSGRKH